MRVWAWKCSVALICWRLRSAAFLLDGLFLFQASQLGLGRLDLLVQLPHLLGHFGFRKTGGQALFLHIFQGHLVASQALLQSRPGALEASGGGLALLEAGGGVAQGALGDRGARAP